MKMDLSLSSYLDLFLSIIVSLGHSLPLSHTYTHTISFSLSLSISVISLNQTLSLVQILQSKLLYNGYFFTNAHITYLWYFSLKINRIVLRPYITRENSKKETFFFCRKLTKMTQEEVFITSKCCFCVNLSVYSQNVWNSSRWLNSVLKNKPKTFISLTLFTFWKRSMSATFSFLRSTQETWQHTKHWNPVPWFKKWGQSFLHVVS